jgi:hypothetical protein
MEIKIDYMHLSAIAGYRIEQADVRNIAVQPFQVAPPNSWIGIFI